MKISKNGLFQPNDFPPVPAYTAEIMHSFKPNAVLELTVPFIEDLLAERGIIVTRESIRLWYPKHSLRALYQIWCAVLSAAKAKTPGLR